jgi:hypothetical protein
MSLKHKRKGIVSTTSATIADTLETVSNVAIALKDTTDLAIIAIRETRLELTLEIAEEISKKYGIDKSDVIDILTHRDEC